MPPAGRSQPPVTRSRWTVRVTLKESDLTDLVTTDPAGRHVRNAPEANLSGRWRCPRGVKTFTPMASIAVTSDFTDVNSRSRS